MGWDLFVNRMLKWTKNESLCLCLNFLFIIIILPQSDKSKEQILPEKGGSVQGSSELCMPHLASLFLSPVTSQEQGQPRGNGTDVRAHTRTQTYITTGNTQTNTKPAGSHTARHQHQVWDSWQAPFLLLHLQVSWEWRVIFKRHRVVPTARLLPRSSSEVEVSADLLCGTNHFWLNSKTVGRF